MRLPAPPGKQIASPVPPSRHPIAPPPKEPPRRSAVQRDRCAAGTGHAPRRCPPACLALDIGAGDLEKSASELDSLELGPAELAGEEEGIEETTCDTRLNSCRCLVLDVACRPVGVLGWKRAVGLDLTKKAEVLEYYDVCVRSVSMRHMIPAVVRAQVVLKHRRGAHVPLNRATVAMRDNGRCVYCGSRSNLTIDHVVPVSKGGPKTWGNVVTACVACNNKKGDRTLKQMGWKVKEPKEPSPFDVRFVLVGGDLRERPRQWANYLQDLVGFKM